MALNIFEPLKFSTQGINDLATHETLVVSNGKITVDIVEPTKSVTFLGTNLSENDGKGLKWTDGRRSKTLSFKQSELWSDMSVNLAEELSYKINETSVLSFSELGSTVTKSKLREVGVLKSLIVSGAAELGGVVYVAPNLNRVGINVEEPQAALGINENGVGIVLGSTRAGTATFGSITNDALELITDNTARITVSNKGDVRVHGTLYADEIVTQRTSPLVFKKTDTDSIYGKGIIWSERTGNKQFAYWSNPDRILSTEIIDLDQGKYFSIENNMVLSKTSLGSTVVESSLKKLGVLTELQVAGDAAVTRTLSTNRIEIGRNFSLEENKLFVSDDFLVIRGETTELKLGSEIAIGTVENLNRVVSVYGRLAVGVSKPKDDVNLTVAGAVSFDNKKFVTGNSAPRAGSFNKGDICWNTDPKASDYVGWVCVTAGSPGAWLPFGGIANR